nr:39S ribosomal protein S30, mitochondrial-like [Lytechinus pictus]
MKLSAKLGNIFKMAAPLRLSALKCASNLSRFQRILPQLVTKINYSSSENAVAKSVEPQYPPIAPPKDSKGELIRIASEPVLAAETPAESIYALTKKYTWNYNIHPYAYHPGFVNFYKHITKTEIVDGFPNAIESWIKSEEVQNLTKSVVDIAQNVLVNDHNLTYRHKQNIVLRDRDVGTQVCKNLINCIIPYLASSNQHLMEADVDFDVEMQSFWQRGSHRFYQFLGKPLLTVRTKQPLREFIEKDADVCQGPIPDWPYHPNAISIFKQCGNAVCFPGFKHGGGHLNAHTQLYLTDDRRSKIESNHILQDVLEGQGISTSFAWLNALALYQQHCCYNDIPHPMTCQTIVTDGKYFSFYCYQLNTLRLDDLTGEDNDLCNVCWQVRDVPLFSAIEEGQMVDFNEDVLKMMVAFLANSTFSSG